MFAAPLQAVASCFSSTHCADCSMHCAHCCASMAKVAKMREATRATDTGPCDANPAVAGPLLQSILQRARPASGSSRNPSMDHAGVAGHCIHAGRIGQVIGERSCVAESLDEGPRPARSLPYEVIFREQVTCSLLSTSKKSLSLPSRDFRRSLISFPRPVSRSA